MSVWEHYPNEETTELLERIADLQLERDAYKERYENAVAGLHIAMDALARQEPQVAELRAQLEYAQTLLDHALKSMEA